MHDSRTVANQFLELARNRGVSLTPMQVLKLVYIAHGWMLGLYGRPLIRDEVQAWQYGPVIPRLYNDLRKYRGNSVTELLPKSPDDALDGDELDIVQQVDCKYGHMSGPALSRLTHTAGSPWALAYAPGVFSTLIPQDLIQDHYQRLAAAG
ncbi:MAG: type II toxin-antitoxin system antitoxin SocA domain-containing protein [Pseudomonadota bacterium]|mgnify:CR=1 FL=1|jgi:uncharacterized phage-associated protein